MSRLHFFSFFFPSSLHFFKLPEGLPRICNQQQCVSHFENQLFTLPSHTHTHTLILSFSYTDLFTFLSLMQQLVYICFSSLTCSLFSLHPSPSHIYTSLFTHHCVPSLIPPFENHLIRKACEAHMSSPRFRRHHTHLLSSPFFFFATKLSSPFSAASSSYFLISCLSVLYLTNYAERLEAVAWPGKQRRSCKDINIHPGINIRSESQVGQMGGGRGVQCRTPEERCLDEEAAASTHSEA